MQFWSKILVPLKLRRFYLITILSSTNPTSITTLIAIREVTTSTQLSQNKLSILSFLLVKVSFYQILKTRYLYSKNHMKKFGWISFATSFLPSSHPFEYGHLKIWKYEIWFMSGDIKNTFIIIKYIIAMNYKMK